MLYEHSANLIDIILNFTNLNIWAMKLGLIVMSWTQHHNVPFIAIPFIAFAILAKRLHYTIEILTSTSQI